MRRGHGSLYDIAVPGYKANLSDVLVVDRARAARQGRAARRDPPRARSRSTTRASRGSTGSSRSPATRATCTRTTCTSSGSTPSARARPATSTRRALTDENIGTSIHFLPVHLLTAYRDRLAPHQPPLPVTERAGARGAFAAALARALRRRHPRRGRGAAPRPRAISRAMKRCAPRSAATLARLGRGGRLHRREDRPRQDARHHRRREHAVAPALGVPDARHGAADGVALAAAARRPGRPTRACRG